MRRAALIVTLCACNQVFGLHQTVSHDATYFDAPTDAPFACPATDATPVFSPYVHLVKVNHCGEYYPSVATGRAVGACHDEQGNNGIYEGPIDGDLALAITAALSISLDLPRLSSDGQTLYARSIDYDTNIIKVVAFARTASGWTPAPDPPFPVTLNPWLGTITQAPDGDRVLISDAGSSTIDEWSEAGGSWHLLASHPTSELGIPAFYGGTASHDGLRLLLRGTPSLNGSPPLYSARASLDAPFRPATALPAVPSDVDDLVISDDCARITFSALDALFYVQQL